MRHAERRRSSEAELDGAPRNRLSERRRELVNPLKDLGSALRQRTVDRLYVTYQAEEHPSLVRRMIQDSIGPGREIYIAAECPPRIPGLRCSAVRVADRTFYRYAMVKQRSPALTIKRFIDVAGSAVLLLLLTPVLILAALAIKLTSPGPVLFRQQRMKLGPLEFTMLKFRTMVVDAEQHKGLLLRANEADGPMFKLRTDPRVTPVGRILRKLSIDELPQLFNVLKGDMSLVGPRPLAWKEQARDSWWRKLRLSVMPGITGLWQVNGRSTSFEDWVRYDLQYVESWSLVQDAKIVLKTIPAVLSSRGAV